MTCDGRKSSLISSTIRSPLRWANSIRRESAAGTLAQPVSVIPSASARLVIVEAVPITMQCPAERDMHASISQNSSPDIRPARRSSSKRQTSVPEPIGSFLYIPRSIGPPGTTIRWDVSAGRTHQLRRGRLVTTAQQHNPVERVGANRLLDVHRHQVPKHHRARPHERFAERDRGELQRKAPRRPDPALDGFGPSWRRCALQLVSSLQELQMPTTGRPRKTLSGKPSAFIP